jgi:hypothetical protein
MSNNYKDILQKLTQKYKFSNPEYITTKSGPDHNPIFTSTVIINFESFEGKQCSTKKEAEKMAAFEALNHLSGKSSSLKICLLLDEFRSPGIFNEITTRELSNNNLDIYVFTDYTSINEKYPEKVIKMIVPNGVCNNTCISTYMGFLLGKNLYDIYFTNTNRDNILLDNLNIDWFGRTPGHTIDQICEIYKYI